ncbi:hypothetical protein D9M72_543180 [compost metagenome]
MADLKRRAATRPHSLPGEIKKVAGAGNSQRIIGKGNGEKQRGDAECGRNHVDDETERHAAERDQSGARPLADRTRDQVDHVRPRRQHHAECKEGKADDIFQLGH